VRLGFRRNLLLKFDPLCIPLDILELENMSIYEILPALDLTQSVHAKISIGMHRQGQSCQSPMLQFAIFFLDWQLKSASGDFLAPRFPCVNFSDFPLYNSCKTTFFKI
jgi:hypothetical protein